MFPILNSGALQFKRRRKWQPAPVLLPEETHGWRGLVACSLWGCKESDMTKQLTYIHTHTHTVQESLINFKISKLFFVFYYNFYIFSL